MVNDRLLKEEPGDLRSGPFAKRIPSNVHMRALPLWQIVGSTTCRLGTRLPRSERRAYETTAFPQVRFASHFALLLCLLYDDRVSALLLIKAAVCL